MTIKLYDLCGRDRAQRFSPTCWRTKYALAHKGLDYETVATSFLEIATCADGNQKTLPVIEDGGKTIGDSFAIADYLEENYPDAPSLFGGEQGRAHALLIDWWAKATVSGSLIKLIVHDIWEIQDDESQIYFRTSREKRFGGRLEDVQSRDQMALKAYQDALVPAVLTLKSQPWIGGTSPTYADYCLFGALQWARTSSDLDLFPDGGAIEAWFERCLDLYDGLGRMVPRPQ